jgi:hypothetical protein
MSDDPNAGTRRVLDLFAGLGGFSAAFENADGWDVTTVDINGEFNPDIQADVLDLRPSDLPEADLVLASPPCTAFSMAASGTHLDENGSPVSNWGAESLALVHHTVGLIKGIDPNHHVIENPMGGMRNELGEPEAHVWWCQYGSDRAKPTDFWGNIPHTFDAKACYNGNESCHHESAPRGADTGTQAGDLSTDRRAEIPYALSEAILEAVEEAYENPPPEQTTLQEVNHV